MVCIGCCLKSAYYGTARYGLSFYGLIMPLSHTMTVDTIGAVGLDFSNKGSSDITYSHFGGIAFSYSTY